MPNTKEKLESNEIKKGKISNLDLKKYIDEYFESSINGDLSYFNNNKNLLDDFFRYFRVKGDKELVEKIKNSFNDKTVEIFFNAEINLKSITIKDFLLKLETVSFKEYSLDIEENNKLKKSFLNKNLSFLNRLLRSENRRNHYLLDEKILTKDLLEQKINGISKSNEQVLEKIFGNNKDLIQLVIADKDLQFAIFSIYSLNETVNYGQLKKVLGSFGNEGRKALIKYFLPVISLENAQESGLITKNEIATELEKIALSNEINGKDNIEAFIKKVDRTNIFIDTSRLSFGNFNFDKISDKAFQSITQEINDAKNYVDKVDILGIDDFKKICKGSKDLNSSLKEEIKSNFGAGNYLTITKKDESGNDKTFYFYIKDTSTTGVELVNVTKINGISSSNTGPSKFHTYQDLFNLLNNSRSKNASISIKQEDIIKNDNELKKIPEKNEIKSKADLENALNELDPKGQNIPLEKMAFKFPKGKNDTDNIFDENFFSVTYNPANNSIKLDNGQVFQEGTNHTLSDFLEAFEVNKCTRFKKIDTVGEFLENISGLNDKFKDIIFKDGKLIPGDVKNIKDYPGINLFIGKDQKKDQSIQIDKIEDGRVSFTLGEYKEGNKEKKEPNTFKGEKNAKNMSYTDFFMLIKNRTLSPKVEKIEEPLSDEHHGKHIHEHRKFMTSWMSNFWSITEIVKGAEQMIHTIQHNLETGNKVKAAKAALFFGKVLPYHLKVELQSEVENSEKETMEKIKKELTGVDSKVMFPMIEHILENKSAPQYEVEAAMFAVLKYGSLYPKTLAKYRGSYIWFQKLGGHKSMIPELTKDALKDDPDLVVTEEVLIQTLLGKQASGDIKPKRRSKIHKEFGGTIQEGLSKESGDGERETSLKMTADGRISYIMGEFKGSTFANGIGGMENVWAMGPDPAWKMNTIPFVILSSGLSLDLHQSLIKRLKTFGGSTPYNSLVLCNSRKNIELYQKYLERVIELYSGGKKSKMYESFQKAKKGSDSGKKAESMKGFWDTYGEELYPVINMNDGFVVTNMNKKDNEILKEYYNKIKGVVTDEAFVAKEDAIDEGFYDQGNSTVAATGGLLSKIKLGDGGTFSSKSSKKILSMHMDFMTEIANNKNLDKDEESMFEFFKQSYINLERDVFSKIQPFIKRGGVDGYKDYQIVVAMNKKGFKVFPHEIDKKNESEYQQMIQDIYNNLKNKSHKEDENEVFGQKLRVEKSIDEILDFSPSANEANNKINA